MYFIDKLARDAFQFRVAQRARIDGYAALCSAVGDVDDGRFQSHQRG